MGAPNSLGRPQDLRDFLDRVPPDVGEDRLEPQVEATGPLRVIDHDAADALDRAAEVLADDGAGRVRVMGVAVDLSISPFLRVRLEEGPQQALTLGKARELLKDGGIDLVEELLLGGEDDFLALEFRPRERLNSQTLRSLPAFLLPLREQLRCFLPRFSKNSLPFCQGRAMDFFGF